MDEWEKETARKESGAPRDLLRSAGDQTLAAKLLGTPRRTFLNRLDAYHIARPRKGDVGEG